MSEPYKKYFNDRIGTGKWYGVYAKNTNSSTVPFSTPPSNDEWDVLTAAGNDHLKFMQVRYSWQALQPDNEGVEGDFSAYQFDLLIYPLMQKCNAIGKYFKIQLAWNAESVGSVTNAPSYNLCKTRAPVPAFMFGTGNADGDTGFKLRLSSTRLGADESNGPYGGGCYFIYAPNKMGKLFPRLWVPAVSAQFSLMLKNLLLYIKNHPSGYGKWFDGIVFPETTLLQSNVNCRNNSDATLNFSSAKMLTAYKGATDTIAATWNEPGHAIFLNHGMLNNDTINGGRGGMTRADWTTWFNSAFTAQGFAISSPDLWDPSKNDEGEPLYSRRCGNMQRADRDSKPTLNFALRNYRDKTIVMGTAQSPSMQCNDPRTIIEWAANITPNGGPEDLRNGLNCGAFLCVRKEKDPIGGVHVWGQAEFIAASRTITLHSAIPPNRTWVDAGSASSRIPAPSGLVRAEVDGVMRLSWIKQGALNDRSGYDVWASATAGSTTLVPGSVLITTHADKDFIAVSRLNPPATAHWLNIRAKAKATSGKTDSEIVLIAVGAAPTLAAPTNLCVNFTDQRITWDYANDTDPVRGFEVYLGETLLMYTGPGRYWIPRLNSAWVAGEHTIKVVARSASQATEKTHTFTYVDQTTGTSCTA